MTFRQRLEERFGDQLHFDYPLAKHTTARVGGSAELLIIAESTDDLLDAVSMAYQYHVPYFILGGGSNILISDHGVRGLVILNRAKAVSFRNTGISVVCTAESGAILSALARQAIRSELGGLEWCVSVPGTVGGAVFGNAGAHGGDVNDNLLSALVWTPTDGLVTYTREMLQYEYRNSVLKRQVTEQKGERPLILSAEFELTPQNGDQLKDRAEEFVAHRKRTQPAGATMGSMFKNPENYYAGQLIEFAELKGYRIGGATVSEKHANFFVNDENATAEDIQQLLAEVWNRVYEQFAIKLEPEVELIGNWAFQIRSE